MTLVLVRSSSSSCQELKYTDCFSQLFLSVAIMYVHIVYVCSTCWISWTLCSDTLLNVFLAIAVDNLANAQELTKVQHSLDSLTLFKFLVFDFSPYFSLAFGVLPNLCLCRMNKRKRRLPVRSLHCRKQRRWLKSAPCLLPTSPLQREFLSV